MDSCCATLRANPHLANPSKCGLNHGDNGFWGERMRGSLNKNSRHWVNQLAKGLRSERKERKIRPSVSCSVITSDNGKETLTIDAPRFERRRANPKNVAAIILGGGAGTKLFPLTIKTATPAVPLGGCYRLIDIPMSNCINSGISKIFVLTQFNSTSLNRHLARTYFGNGVNFGDEFVEVLAATQTPGEAGMKWFQGTADAVRKFTWVFEDAKNKDVENILILSGDHLYRMDYMDFLQEVDTTLLGLSQQDAANAPYIASMGVYMFRTDILLKLLRWNYPTSNDFGSEIIPSAVMDHNVQAYIFRDYWDDIGTIKSFYDANLALTDEFSKFQFYDPKTPFFTSPRFLPPTKIDKCQIKDSIISHGCFLRECRVEHSIVGERSRLDYGVELKDTLMMGADYYQTEPEIAALLAEDKVPIGIGRNTKTRKCIIDKNAKIGKDVVIMNKDGVQEAERSEEGFYIRSGITIILEKATINDGTII